jgi:hypothetical protein
MKKGLLVAVAGLSFLSGAAFAAKVWDWKDLNKARTHLHQVIAEIRRAAAANDHDMGGHAGKAADLAAQAESEIGMAIDAAKSH